jgi:hypothetical protein
VVNTTAEDTEAITGDTVDTIKDITAVVDITIITLTKYTINS